MVPATAVIVLAVLPAAGASPAPDIVDTVVNTVDDVHDHEHLSGAGLVSPEPALDVLYDMIFPVIGDVYYTDTFGACRSGCSRTHEGIDLMADKMTPIVAVADGTVGWMHAEQGGKCCAMSLDHADGWESYFIHMNNDTPGTDDGQGWGFAEDIYPGAPVYAGQLIGWVGDSGNAESTAPHLHYELHMPDGTVVNPYESLNAAPVLSAPAVPVAARGCDYDGDGYHDLAIGSPGEDLGIGGVRTDSGAVTVIYGSGSGLVTNGAQNWHYNSQGVTGGLQAGARFGEARTCGDFDGDGYDDLAIGAPGRDRNAKADAGAVTILYGTPGGLQAYGGNLFDLGSPGVKGVPNAGSGFGAVLAAGDFDGDGYDDLAVGAPDATRDGHAAAGIVVVLLGSAAGIDGTSSLLVDGIHGLPGTPEADDRFGAALAVADFDGDAQDDLVVGIPGETNGGHPGSGEVMIVPGGNNVFDKWRGRRLWAPSKGWVDNPTSAFGAAVTTGDLNGDGLPDLAVAAPGDTAGGTDAGTVRIFLGNGGYYLVTVSTSVEISRESDGITGVAASGERFGASLTADDFDADGYDDLAIGVPGSAVGVNTGAGVVVTVNGSATGIDTWTADVLHQNNLAVFWSASTDAEFGSFVSSGDYAAAGVASLAIGVPGQTVGTVEGAGAVHVVYGRPGGLDLDEVDIWREALGTLPGKSEPGDAWSKLASPSD